MRSLELPSVIRAIITQAFFSADMVYWPPRELSTALLHIFCIWAVRTCFVCACFHWDGSIPLPLVAFYSFYGHFTPDTRVYFLILYVFIAITVVCLAQALGARHMRRRLRRKPNLLPISTDEFHVFSSKWQVTPSSRMLSLGSGFSHSLLVSGARSKRNGKNRYVHRFSLRFHDETWTL